MALSHASPLSAVIHSDEAKECRRWRHKIHTYSHGGRGTHCLANDDVDGVDDPGQVTQDCQHETNPELTLHNCNKTCATMRHHGVSSPQPNNFIA